MPSHAYRAESLLVRGGALTATRPSKTVPALRNALSDTDRYVRAQAAKSLGRFPQEAAQAVPMLTAALDDKEKDVRAAAAYALAEFGPAEARVNLWKTVAT